MLVQQIAVLAAGFIDLFLGFLVISRNSKELINRVFLLLSLSYAFWSFSLFFYQNPIIFSSFFWIRLTYVLVVVFISFVLVFSFIFPIRVSSKFFKIGSFVGVTYILFSIWLLFFTPWFVTRVVHDPHKGLQTILGSGYLWWGVYSWFPLIIASLNIAGKTKKVNRLVKIQMNYFWAAFTIFGIAVCIPDVVIPLIWHDTRYFYISPVSNFIFSGTVAYIILRHRFLDVRRIIANVLSQIFIILVLGVLYSTIAIAIGKYFFPKNTNIMYILVTVGVCLVVRLITQPLEQSGIKQMQKLFYKKRYDREEVLQQVSHMIIQSLDLYGLSTLLAKYLTSIFNTHNASVVVRSKKESNIFTVYSLEPIRKVVHRSKSFEKILEETTSKFVITDELPATNPVKKFFQDRHVAISSPLFVRKEQVGYLTLYEKKDDEIYTDYDFKTIELISPYVALALQNVLHLEEIKQFNKILRKEVSYATTKLQKANNALLQLDHLKDEFISMASHELRTPTTVIKSFLWIVLHKDTSISLESKKRLERIYELSTHMGNLIRDMLDVSLIESGKMHLAPELFNISQLVKDTMGEMEATMREQRKIVFLGSDNHVVYADRDKIYQVVGNLLTNAIKYSKANGKITVSISENGKYVSISVIDNGMGISKENIKKLFTKFGKLHSVHSSEGQIPGSGLGLYITKRILDFSSGTLSVKSTLGRGSTFMFTLPKQTNNGKIS